MKVAVIGGGPGGLVTLKTLLSRDIDAVLFEAEDAVGGTFRYRSYENAELVSSKQLTCFSDFRLPRDHQDHVSLQEYVAYLEDYCRHFDLYKHIKLSTRVISISPIESAEGHVVTTQSNIGYEITEHFDTIAICTGLHVTPSIPSIPGIEHVPQYFHSSHYKYRTQIANKNVLVLGCGETAMDVAYEAIKADCPQVVLAHRGGWLSFPKALSAFRVFGKAFKGRLPIDGLITNLFETAYVHSSIRTSHLRWFVSDFVIKRVLWFLTGTSVGCNQWVGELPPERLGRAYVFLNKSTKAMPYINRPWMTSRGWMSKITEYTDPPEDASSDKIIEVAPWPERINPDGTVTFTPSSRKEYSRIRNIAVKPDVVVFCTGYTQNLTWLHPSYPLPSRASCRNILHPSHPTLAYIGFVRPGVGAIPPIAEMQAMWWTSMLLGEARVPKEEEWGDYLLLVREEARVKYGVDHSAYMSTLAKDIGAAPGLWELWRAHGIHALLTYCFGAAFTTLYRLVGPWKDPDAAEIAKGELWETIKRRGVIGNMMWGVLPMMFYGILNGVALLVEMVIHVWRAVNGKIEG
ncbi:hypothetical protein YB2330_002676 [Saitoella coloradoensis]